MHCNSPLEAGQAIVAKPSTVVEVAMTIAETIDSFTPDKQTTYKDGLAATLSLFNKTATRLGEAAFITFNPSLNGPSPPTAAQPLLNRCLTAFPR